MRIAMVSEHASPLAALGDVDAGGQNVHVAALACALARLGTDVVVHTRRDDPALLRRVALTPAAGGGSAGVARGRTDSAVVTTRGAAAGGVGATRGSAAVDHIDAGPPAPVPKDLLLEHMDAFADELVRCWRAERPDIVHAHFWMSGHAALAAADELGIPVVQTFHALGVVRRRHQGDRDTSPPERLGIERDVMRRADHIVATCTDEVFELLRMGGDRARLTVIPCGVDLDVFTPEGRRMRRRGRLRRIVCLGRLVERKGVGNVISALAHVPGVELVVAGGPARAQLREHPEARRLLALAREAGVADRVDLRGRMGREDVAALLRSADAVVCVPWYEPFGIVPLEAMACGVPVVAAAVGGMVDTVVDGVTGEHVPPRDPERLAEALVSLLADEAAPRRAAYGAAGIERARRLYGWSRVAAATLDVYTRQLQRHRRASVPVRVPTAREHHAALLEALEALEPALDRIAAWGERLADRLVAGARLLAVGNGGSAAEAQHLTAELVGRYQTERQPLSALCLHADTSSLTAIGNDYGSEEAFARQVLAHGRPGDVLVALSTSGRSVNVLRAVEAANEIGMTTWALTGSARSPLVETSDEALRLPGASVATTQELQLVAIHVLCGAVDRELALRAASPAAGVGNAPDGGQASGATGRRRESHRLKRTSRGAAR